MSDVLTASEKERLKRISPDLGGVTGQGVSLENILARLASQADLDAAELLTALLVAATTASGAKVVLAEGTNNGENTLTLQAPASLGGDRTVTFPDSDLDLSAVKALAEHIIAEGESTPTQLELYEPTQAGTNKIVLEAPATLAGDRTVSFPDADLDLADVQSRAAKVVLETTTVAAQLELHEGTNHGSNKVSIKPANSLAADRTLALPDADVDLGDLALMVSGNATITNGTTSVVVNVGAAFNNKVPIVSFGENPTAATKVWAAPPSGGNLTIEVDQDPTADTVVHYFIDGR